MPEPVELPVTVRNPLDRHTLVWISIGGVPEGYYVYFPRQYLYLEVHAERNLELLVITLCEVRDLSSSCQRPRKRLPAMAIRRQHAV